MPKCPPRQPGSPSEEAASASNGPTSPPPATSSRSACPQVAESSFEARGGRIGTAPTKRPSGRSESASQSSRELPGWNSESRPSPGTLSPSTGSALLCVPRSRATRRAGGSTTAISPGTRPMSCPPRRSPTVRGGPARSQTGSAAGSRWQPGRPTGSPPGSSSARTSCWPSPAPPYLRSPGRSGRRRKATAGGPRTSSSAPASRSGHSCGNSWNAAPGPLMSPSGGSAGTTSAPGSPRRTSTPTPGCCATGR